MFFNAPRLLFAAVLVVVVAFTVPGVMCPGLFIVAGTSVVAMTPKPLVDTEACREAQTKIGLMALVPWLMSALLLRGGLTFSDGGFLIWLAAPFAAIAIFTGYMALKIRRDVLEADAASE